MPCVDSAATSGIIFRKAQMDLKRGEIRLCNGGETVEPLSLDSSLSHVLSPKSSGQMEHKGQENRGTLLGETPKAGPTTIDDGRSERQAPMTCY